MTIHLRRTIKSLIVSLLPETFVARHRRRAVFQGTYRSGLWGSDGTSQFFSGPGSTGEPVAIYVGALFPLISENIKQIGPGATIVDIGCGDFRVARALLEQLPPVNYVGCDVVPELIQHNKLKFSNPRVRFKTLDAVTEKLPTGQICLVRQVFQHLSNQEILQIIDKLRAFKYIYVTEGQPIERVGRVNPDKPANYQVRFDWTQGRGRGVELDQPPFGLSLEEICRVPGSTNGRELIVTQRIFV